jgi:hypothetical protein
MRHLAASLVLCIVLGWTAAAAAGPRGSIEGEPKRSYGAIDVIMYQTSW